MDLSALKAAVARDRKRVEDMDRIAGLLDVFADRAGVPVTVDAGAARIVVTVDVSGLQAPRVHVGPDADVDICQASMPPASAKTFLVNQAATGVPKPSRKISAELEASEPAAHLRGGPLDDEERAIVQEMLNAGATGKEIGARLNRDPRQFGGVIAAIRKGPRKSMLTPPAAKPVDAVPDSAPDPVGGATVPPVQEPVAKVAPVGDAPPFAGEMSEDARIAARWDDHIATVPETKLFDRAGDLDLMTCLSEGMSAKDFATTRERTPDEAAGRFLALMGDAPRTLANQGLCIAALRRAIGSWAA